MTDHPSALELDEAAAGMAVLHVRTHVSACESCRERLSAISAARAFAKAHPEFHRVLASLPGDHAPRAPLWARWLRPVVGGSLAAAASVVLVIAVVRPAAGLRAKGSASLELLADGKHDSSAPRIGARVELRIAPGAHRYVLVAAIDESGQATPLWPSRGQESGAVAPGERVSAFFLVTPGKARIVAALSNEPARINDLVERHERPGFEWLEREIRPVP